MTQPLLKIEDLAVSFDTSEGTVRAVNGVNMSVYPGQTLGVVGESGCGKSVSALSTLQLVPTPPGSFDGGRILFDGENVLDKSEKEMQKIRGNHIAMIFQEPMTSLNPVYTVGDQICEAILLHQHVNQAEAKDIAEQALRDVGIAEPRARLDVYPHQMSGGMRQRIMIAMALACKPRLLLADEPTTALDVTIQAQILELLRKLQTEHGMSVMLITHDLGVVAENADVIAVMYAGRVVEYGSVHDVFANPMHPYTQGLFESIPKLGETHDRLPTIPGQVPNPARLPAGCPFHPRCKNTRCLAAEAPAEQVTTLSAAVVEDDIPADNVMKDCVDGDPPLLEVAPGHWAACWHAPGHADGKATRPDVSYRRAAEEPVAG
ncbi:MAG: ATP-binding cassette domain-containing protein [Phycisphaera sp.]|nr:ATP-binding cassette domain-containing protein [Phycisphaera sp.]